MRPQRMVLNNGTVLTLRRGTVESAEVYIPYSNMITLGHNGISCKANGCKLSLLLELNDSEDTYDIQQDNHGKLVSICLFDNLILLSISR